MFWIIATILVLIALAFVLPALLGKRSEKSSDSPDKGGDSDAIRRVQNIEIAKEQLADLEQRFEKGEMDEEVYQANRDELELSLFNDMQEAEQDKAFNAGRQSSGSMLGSALIALLVPVIAIGMYLKLGNPAFTTEVSSKLAAKEELRKDLPMKADGTPDIDAMVAGLQKKLEASPDNPKGWFMLGRSYMVMKRYPEAAKAYEHAYKLMPESPDVLLSLADSLSMANGGRIAGRPSELIEKVLKIDPDNMTGLWLGGMAARQQLDYVTAVERWQKVLPQLTEATEQQEVRSLIADAMKHMTPAQLKSVKTSAVAVNNAAAVKTKPADKSGGINVHVSLSDALKSQANPDDLVFIYAKALSGPPMPLAAAKKRVKDLPVDIVLDDSMAMMPTMKLSDFSEVVVGARISKSGRPIAQDGDLYTEKKPVRAGDRIQLDIDSVKGQAPTTNATKQAVKQPPASPQNKAAVGSGVKVSVALSKELKDQASPDDLVFIYAKALSGPPMPLAAAKKRVSDLPVMLTLDDSMAMIPAMKISAFPEVVVGARVSKSGQPIAQNGDLFSEKKPVKLGETVELMIDSVVKK